MLWELVLRAKATCVVGRRSVFWSFWRCWCWWWRRRCADPPLTDPAVDEAALLEGLLIRDPVADGATLPLGLRSRGPSVVDDATLNAGLPIRAPTPNETTLEAEAGRLAIRDLGVDVTTPAAGLSIRDPSEGCSAGGGTGGRGWIRRRSSCWSSGCGGCGGWRCGCSWNSSCCRWGVTIPCGVNIACVAPVPPMERGAEPKDSTLLWRRGRITGSCPKPDCTSPSCPVGMLGSGPKPDVTRPACAAASAAAAAASSPPRGPAKGPWPMMTACGDFPGHAALPALLTDKAATTGSPPATSTSSATTLPAGCRTVGINLRLTEPRLDLRPALDGGLLGRLEGRG